MGARLRRTQVQISTPIQILCIRLKYKSGYCKSRSALAARLAEVQPCTIYAAIDRGKGEIDVHPDIWLPNQEAYTNDLVPKGTLKLSKKPYEGNQGYCVSQAFAKK
jgi:hypothetical protein